VAVLAAATILVRNEFGGYADRIDRAAVHVLRVLSNRPHRSDKEDHSRLRGPLACAVLLCVVAYWRSVVHFPELSAGLQDKHTVNMCQIYAFGFQQRSSAWGGNPWLDCQTLMQETFGKGLPSFAEMLSANPAAVIKHLLWNLSLIPNGLELLLFRRDVWPRQSRLLPGGGGVLSPFSTADSHRRPPSRCMAGSHDFYKRSAEWFRNRMRFAIAFVPMLAVALIVALVERPRPSYLFYVTIVVIVLFMESVSALVRERPTLGTRYRDCRSARRSATDR